MKKFVMYRNTKSRVEHEQEDVLIEQCDENKVQIAFSTFNRQCEGLMELARNLGYQPASSIKDDWSVGFYKSRYAGLPCLFLSHTECDFIFLRPTDRDNFQTAFAAGMTTAEWQRATEYGPKRKTT